MQNGGAAVDLARILGGIGHVGRGLWLLLGVGVLLVGAQDGDLLPLLASLGWLGVGLQKMEGLAVLLYEMEK